MSPAFPDLRDAWWLAHGEPALGWEPPAEPDVLAWARDAEARDAELDERWSRPARAGAAADALYEALGIVDLRALAETPIDEATHWVEVRIVDDADKPVRGARLVLIRPDGARERASTDDDGVARWKKLPSGATKVVFDDDAASFAEVG